MHGLIVSIGEPMIEFNQDRNDPTHYLQGYGGDTSNFCVAVARQGGKVAFVTRLGDDGFGRQFLTLWEREGVDVSGVSTDGRAPTAVYFVTHSDTGHAFSYLRAGSAAAGLAPANLPTSLLEKATYLHVSGITQAISVSACDAVFAAIAQVRGQGGRVFYDPNFRPALWPLARARAIVDATLRDVDVLMPSLEDAQALTGLVEPDAIVDHYLARGVETVCLKLGARGVLLAHAGVRTRLEGHTVKSVDATGAGDCFDGSFMARIAAGDSPEAAARYANAAAALATTGFGAVAPIPTPDAVAALL